MLNTAVFLQCVTLYWSRRHLLTQIILDANHSRNVFTLLPKQLKQFIKDVMEQCLYNNSVENTNGCVILTENAKHKLIQNLMAFDSNVFRCFIMTEP